MAVERRLYGEQTEKTVTQITICENENDYQLEKGEGRWKVFS